MHAESRLFPCDSYPRSDVKAAGEIGQKFVLSTRLGNLATSEALALGQSVFMNSQRSVGPISSGFCGVSEMEPFLQLPS